MFVFLFSPFFFSVLHLEQISARHISIQQTAKCNVLFIFEKTPFVSDYGINTISTAENLENINKHKEENRNSLNFHNFDKHILTYKHIFFQSFINVYIYIHS